MSNAESSASSQSSAPAVVGPERLPREVVELLTLALRVLPASIPSLEELGLPSVVARLASLPRGLILVTGPTGSGKSTALAAIIGLINLTHAKHIVTIEDPVEFVHADKLSRVE